MFRQLNISIATAVKKKRNNCEMFFGFMRKNFFEGDEIQQIFIETKYIANISHYKLLVRSLLKTQFSTHIIFSFDFTMSTTKNSGKTALVVTDSRYVYTKPLICNFNTKNEK